MRQDTREMLSAIRSKNLEKVVEMVQHHHDLINVITPFGTWLHVASAEGAYDIVQYFVELGLDINKFAGTYNGNSLNEAAGEGHIDVVRYLLTNGSKLDTSDPESNPLFSAIYGGHKDIVQLLLDSGIDASVRYTGKYMKNMDAYDFAVERGQKEIAAILEPYRK